MSKATLRRNITEKNRIPENNNRRSQQSFSLSKHLRKIYPIGLDRSNSALSLSSVSLSLSQTSNDSSNTDYSSSTTTTSSALEQKISLALKLIAPRNSHERPREFLIPKVVHQPPPPVVSSPPDNGEPRRCNWITKSSDKDYVSFHDEQWGVPVYDDRKLFELLAMSGMLMDCNWTEILKRQELFREAFVGFDPNDVAKLGEDEIMDITADKAIMLQEGRVRSIVDNAKCILKIMREFGSFSNYMWSFVNHKPIINRYRHPRNIPLRTPKAEVVSKDLQKRGFRLVGPVIVCSFMQAAGLTIDHIVDCYRYDECVSLAERPWRHI